MAKVVAPWILFAFFLHSALWTLVDMKNVCSNKEGWDKAAPCYHVQDISSNAVLCMFRVFASVSECCKFRRHTNTEQEKLSPENTAALDRTRYCLNVLNNDTTNDASCYFEYLLNESKDTDLYDFLMEKMNERERGVRNNSKIDAKIKKKVESIPSHVKCENVDEILTTSTGANALDLTNEREKESATDVPRASEPNADSPPQQYSMSWHMIVILVLQTGFTLFLAYYLILVVLPDSEYVYPEKNKFDESRRTGSSNA